MEGIDAILIYEKGSRVFVSGNDQHENVTLELQQELLECLSHLGRFYKFNGELKYTINDAILETEEVHYRGVELELNGDYAEKCLSNLVIRLYLANKGATIFDNQGIISQFKQEVSEYLMFKVNPAITH